MWFRRRPKTYRSSPLSPALQAEVNATQQKIEGSDLAARQAAHVVAIGAGGIGAITAMALARKGIGRLTIIDHDLVDWPNLTRQAPYTRRDVGKNKARQLAKHLTREAPFLLTVTAYSLRFQELVEQHHDFGDTTVFVAGPDNNPTRQAVTRFAVDHHLPVIHAAIGRDACQATVFIQEPSAACWGCAHPEHLDDRSYPCGLGATIDPLLVVAGVIAYAVDSLVSRRNREFNARHFFLDGALPDRTRTIARRHDCPICQPLRSAARPPPLPLQEAAE